MFNYIAKFEILHTYLQQPVNTGKVTPWKAPKIILEANIQAYPKSAKNGVIIVIIEVVNVVVNKIHLNPYLEDNHAPIIWVQTLP